MDGGIHGASPVSHGPLCHGLHVATGAEGAACSGEHNAADRVVDLDLAEHPLHGCHHGLGHGVSPVRAVHGQDRDAVVDLGQQVIGSCVELRHADSPPGGTAAETNRTPAIWTGGISRSARSLTTLMPSPRPEATGTKRRSCRACAI